MPGVICYRTPSQDCILLGHLYRSSYDRSAWFPSYDGRDARIPHDSSSLIYQSTGQHTNIKPSCRLCSLAHPPLTLLSVSPEVVHLILAALPGSDILKCRYVCKTLKRLIDQSMRLQYIIQSNARGLEPLLDSGSASLDLSNLLFRERSWTMFGSIASTPHSLRNPPDPVGGLASKLYCAYYSGSLALGCGSHVTEHMLHPRLGGELREYEIPDLGVDNLEPVAATQDVLVYSTGKTIYVYSKANNEVVSVLSAPHPGTVEVPSVCGNWMAALSRSERFCSGVLIWNWESGELTDTLHDTHSLAISVGFLDTTTLAVVHTDRTACSVRIDTYELSPQGTVLKSSVSLPDAHPTKWYARADIYTGDESAPPGSEHMMRNDGVVAIDLEMRIRSPHNPEVVTADRQLTAILVISKRILSLAHTNDQETPVISTPWASWSANHFRMLTGVRLSPQRPVWGHRLVTVGPEPDKISLFDFCPIGVKAVAQVWKGNVTWGASSNGRGGVSVRAALAQRARTLVRASTAGVVASWFDNLEPLVAQMPYVVSVRRGVGDVVDTMIDGGNIVVTLQDRGLAEHPASTRVILFNFIP